MSLGETSSMFVLAETIMDYKPEVLLAGLV